MKNRLQRKKINRRKNRKEKLNIPKAINVGKTANIKLTKSDIEKQNKIQRIIDEFLEINCKDIKNENFTN